MNFETQAIRLQTERSQHREHSTPIFPTSSFVFEDAEQMRALFADEQEGNIYSRFTNPTVREFEEKIAKLEGVDDAFATATGMAAVYASFMALLQKGDHLICSRAVFGSTHTIVGQFLPKWGIETTLIDPSRPENWQAALRPNTRMIFLETPTNPGLELVDLEFAGKFAHENGLILNVDNCFATPYLQQPARWGAHIITHSATKFIDGQGRVLGGIICGQRDLIAEVRKFCRSTGPTLSPFNAWVLSKSLETLAVRMDRHCDNAVQVADYLEKHPAVERVIYPFSPTHPDYNTAKKQMKKGGGLVAFEVKGGIAAGRRFLDKLKMLSLSANLGDTRSIATHPASTTHARLTPEARQEAGITDGLIRISVGLEDVNDILQDIGQALETGDYTIPVNINKLQYFKSKQAFPLENGGVLSELTIAYHSFGQLNATRDNVIWVCHALTANSDVSDWWSGLFGAGNVFDPEKYFIVCANIIGSCYGSTGARSLNPATGRVYGKDFPLVSIRDQAKAHDLLREHLGISAIALCIGGSCGGHQVLEFACLIPEKIKKMALLVCAARESAWAIGIHEAQRMALTADPTLWDYSSDQAGEAGLRAARAIGLLSYRTIEAYRTTQNDEDGRLEGFRAAGYQQHQGEKLVRRFYAQCYYHLTRTLDTHHIGRGRAGLESALQQLTMPAFVFSIEKDLLIPPFEQQLLTKYLPNGQLVTLDSPYGHDGFLIETSFLRDHLLAFLKVDES